MSEQEKREITSEQALKLMEAMCADAAENFEGGVLAYIKADKDMKDARRKLDRALSDFMSARKRKYNALCVALPEYAFFRGKGKFDPQLNAEYIVSKLIQGVLEEINDVEFRAIAHLIEPIEEARNEKDF